MDVMAWSIYTDLQDHPKGMVVELVLGGTARDLIREVPLAHKMTGVVFDPGGGHGPRQYTGLDFIIYCLHMHFAHVVEEESSRQLMETLGIPPTP